MLQQNQWDKAKRPEEASPVVDEHVSRQASGLVKLAPTKELLQGADGRYSDNDSGRSYYK